MQNDRSLNVVRYYYALFFVIITPCNVYGQHHFISEEDYKAREKTIQLIDEILNWNVIKVDGTDDTGKRGDFNILILMQNEEWMYANERKLQSGKTASDVIPQYLYDKLETIKDARSIICLGTASQEGGHDTENSRAERRAKHLGNILKAFLVKESIQKDVYILNLGQFVVKTKTTDTSKQRSIIIILIEKSSDRNVNLDQALKNALEKKKNLRIKVNRYYSYNSGFKVIKY